MIFQSVKYTLNAIADKGLDEKSFTSYRLTSEVIFAESTSHRYELCFDTKTNKYRWSEVLSPHSLDAETLLKMDLPLESQYVRVLQSDLNWSDILWGPESVQIRGESYPIRTIQFYKRKQNTNPQPMVAQPPNNDLVPQPVQV